jgi:hypothetical protein
MATLNADPGHPWPQPRRPEALYSRQAVIVASRHIPACARGADMLPWLCRFPIGIKRESGERLQKRDSGAAPATVSGERRSIMPLGLPGKAERSLDPRARRPADVVKHINRAGCPGRSSDDGRSPARFIRASRIERRRSTGRSPSAGGR